MAPPRKPHGTAVDRRNGQKSVNLNAISGLKVEPYPPPEGVCEEVEDAWKGFWEDRPAALLTPAARVVLIRWARALDRYLRVTAEADLEPIVSGSQGQQVANPLYRVADSALRTIDACERQLGIGPLNAAGLGIAAVSEARTLADMNARYGGAEQQQDEEPDPRLKVIRGDTGS